MIETEAYDDEDPAAHSARRSQSATAACSALRDSRR
ncbi:MAG: hypothetical protein EOO23_01815 [Comamonadaceae bacterium]|nr:MAG: hypothetical protein EOO23_01815 [Comamonadaceae bacterium]